jgi:hypothetical protein
MVRYEVRLFHCQVDLSRRRVVTVPQAAELQREQGKSYVAEPAGVVAVAALGVEIEVDRGAWWWYGWCWSICVM